MGDPFRDEGPADDPQWTATTFWERQEIYWLKTPTTGGALRRIFFFMVAFLVGAALFVPFGLPAGVIVGMHGIFREAQKAVGMDRSVNNAWYLGAYLGVVFGGAIWVLVWTAWVG